MVYLSLRPLWRFQKLTGIGCYLPLIKVLSWCNDSWVLLKCFLDISDRRTRIYLFSVCTSFVFQIVFNSVTIEPYNSFSCDMDLSTLLWFHWQVICDTSQVNASGGLDWFVLSDNKMEFTDVSWKVFSLPQSGLSWCHTPICSLSHVYILCRYVWFY